MLPGNITGNIAATLRRVNQVATLWCCQAMLRKLVAVLLVQCYWNAAAMLLQCCKNIDNQHCSNAATMLTVDITGNIAATLRRVNQVASLQHCQAMLWQQISNVASIFPLRCCYIDIMWGLQHCCSSVTILANGYFCATLQQRCSVSTKLHFSNVSQQCQCSSAKPFVCDDALTLLMTLYATLLVTVYNIATTLPQHCCYSDIICGLQHCCSGVTILPVDISVQHCGNVAAYQPSCV